MSDIIARIQNEPAVFWGLVATAAIAIYHVINPAGDKDSLITQIITTFGPLIAGFVIRSKVTPVPPAA